MTTDLPRLVRCAFFNGRIRPGMEDAFHRHVDERMVPLWTRFPAVRDVRVLRQHQSDVADPALPLVLVMHFDSHEDIAAALASPVRRESQQASRALLEMFEGAVFHTVFDARVFALSSNAT
ncbi:MULTISPECIES: hypothetical protein [unclassified Variovorax]|uniref:hypothetical protein n=1 Tax=unclassified Variovorax TaxID=663243 RepID=UPI0015FF9BD5|nr:MULTISPECIES: hypothetical protein [unclassified Variovorax]MBB1599421.1 hypothetical protein [Variovorax sp. UMC13]MDM0088877.1 hypothetical protein [Variovorax sp. J22G40]MDM0146950.1 hypothetical protein [Variovorax sp. J2P1-31]